MSLSEIRPAELIGRVLAGATDVRRGEGKAVLASALLFFLVLAVVMVLRPVREAMGLIYGIERVRLLFFWTMAVILLLAPALGYLVSRVPRRALLTISFRFFALILVGFYLALTLLPQRHQWMCVSVYYVYHSAFNLFVVSLFWALMADLFHVAVGIIIFPPGAAHENCRTAKQESQLSPLPRATAAGPRYAGGPGRAHPALPVVGQSPAAKIPAGLCAGGYRGDFPPSPLGRRAAGLARPGRGRAAGRLHRDPR